MRGLEDSRADPHCGAFGIFRSMGLLERALAGAETIPGARAAAVGVSAFRNADDRAESFVRETPTDEFHRRASRVSRKRFGATGEIVRRVSKCECGHRRRAGGTGTAALFGARFSRQISGPHSDGKRHLRRERIQMVFSVPRNARRIFRLLPQAACILADLRVRSARRSIEKSLLPERAEAPSGNRCQGVSPVRSPEAEEFFVVPRLNQLGRRGVVWETLKARDSSRLERPQAVGLFRNKTGETP